MTEQPQSPLKASERELVSASKAVDRMKAAENLEEFEDEWRIFLGAIEKCWVKAERACQPHRNKFQPWQGKYKKERKSDPLLKYLYHARHSDQHSVQEMLEPKPASRTIGIGGPGKSVYIDRLTIENGQITEYVGSEPLIVTDYPNRVELVSVLSSKRWYRPPIKHKNIEIGWPAPITVAQLGLGYYLRFIEDVKAEFFEN
jgi:hypothetical protein